MKEKTIDDVMQSALDVVAKFAVDVRNRSFGKQKPNVDVPDEFFILRELLVVQHFMALNPLDDSENSQALMGVFFDSAIRAIRSQLMLGGNQTVLCQRDWYCSHKPLKGATNLLVSLMTPDCLRLTIQTPTKALMHLVHKDYHERLWNRFFDEHDLSFEQAERLAKDVLVLLPNEDVISHSLELHKNNDGLYYYGDYKAVQGMPIVQQAKHKRAKKS